MKQLPNLISIRFILASLVILFHIPQFFENRGFPFYDDLPIFHKGTEAVWMFFSLSGFLIINQLYQEKKESHTIDMKSFFLKRILRILPLYYLVLIFGFLYYRTILPFLGYPYQNDYNLIKGLLLAVTFFSNVFSTYSPGGIVEILWSIGIEEQFYFIIAPLFFILPYKKIILFLSLFTLVYFLLYFSQNFIYLKQYQMLFFYFSFSGLCALLLNKKTINTFVFKIRIPILIGCVFYFTSSFFKNYLPEMVYAFFSMLLFGLTISVLSQKPIKVLDTKIMNYLGKRAYGIYMLHAIVMQFVGFVFLKFLDKLNWPNALNIIIIHFLIFTGTVAMAALSYKYYESYFLNLKSKIKK